MKSVSRRIGSICALCLLSWGTQAVADTKLMGIDPRGLYVGGAIGYSFGDFEGSWNRVSAGNAAREQAARQGQDLEVISTPTRSEDSKISYKLYGGYRFNRHIGLEFGYADLGERAFSARVERRGPDAATPPPEGAATIPNPSNVQSSIDGLYYSLMLYYPVGDWLDPFVRIGGFSWEADASANYRIDTDCCDETDLLFGVGAEFVFSDRLRGRAEWQRIFISGARGVPEIDMLDIGLLYSFGR